MMHEQHVGQGYLTGNCLPSVGAAQIGACHGYLKVTCPWVVNEAMGVHESISEK